MTGKALKAFAGIAAGTLALLWKKSLAAGADGAYQAEMMERSWENEGHAGGHVNLPGLALGAVIVLAAYLFLLVSFLGWDARRKSGATPPVLNDWEWVVVLVGYFMVAAVLAFPVFLIVKWFDGLAVARAHWWEVQLCFMALLTYLRRF